MIAQRKDRLKECRGEPGELCSGFVLLAPASTCVVLVSVKARSSSKTLRMSHMIPPPHAEKVPQRIQVNAEAAVKESST